MTKNDWLILNDVLSAIERSICSAEARQHDMVHEHIKRARDLIDRAFQEALK